MKNGIIYTKNLWKDYGNREGGKLEKKKMMK